ncbi:RHS repeat domain-containing protein [Flavobacterium sp.]|uniref:RHS repeat domain-containing protein n=1 Tax=Flavobacterium sp. TaxID=239 RepID=UPI003B994611
MGYSVTGNYDETLSYDKHGNIQTLQRNGFADADFGTSVEIDNLVYAYDGNQLLAVQDMSNSLNGFRDNVNNGNPDYGYDAYGNMTSDANKRIEDIDYNHLNLPTVINFQNNSGRIRYTYDALGVKLRKEVDDINGTTTTDYLDGFQYKNEVLSFFPTSEGYVEFKEPARFFYVYNYTDHLGNVRMSYTDNGVAVPKILEENHYYPFGLKHENYASERFEFIKEPHGTLYVIQPTERREWQYKYNGKEWQDELGLMVYDYGARLYDPAIGKFWQVDPVVETSRRFSPYSYALDNPVYFIDRDGMYADTLESQNEGECCPGLPFGNTSSPKETSPLGGTMQNFTPSAKTEQLMSEATELLSNVFGYDASFSVGESVGAGATVGPVKVEGEATIVEVSAKTTEKNLVEVEMKGPGAKVSGSVGIAKGSASVSTGSAKVELSKEGKINSSATGMKRSATGTLGKDTKLSLSNSLTLGVSAKIPTPYGVTGEIGGNVNLYNAAVGVGKMLQATVSYLSDYVSNVFSLN